MSKLSNVKKKRDISNNSANRIEDLQQMNYGELFRNERVVMSNSMENI